MLNDIVDVILSLSIINISYRTDVFLLIREEFLERILFRFSINRTIMVTILHNKLIKSINEWNFWNCLKGFWWLLMLFKFWQTWSKYRFIRSQKCCFVKTKNLFWYDLYLYIKIKILSYILQRTFTVNIFLCQHFQEFLEKQIFFNV